MPTIDKAGRIPKRRRLDKDPKLLDYERMQLATFLEGEDFTSKFRRLLPSMANTMLNNPDWSLLQKFSAPTMDPSLDFDVKAALDSEFAALCVWFLYIDVADNLKVGAYCALRFIYCGTYEATNISIDQKSIESLLVSALGSKITDVQRQVCLALAFVAYNSASRLKVTFGADIQDQLLQLVQICDSDLTLSVLTAIAGIGLANEDMRMKIVQTEISYSWLAKLMSSREDDKSIIATACWIVACFHFEKFSQGLWDCLKKIIPVIVKAPSSLKSCCCNCSSKSCCCMHNHFYEYQDHIHLLRSVANAILTITLHASRKQIRELVDLGGLKVLFFVLDAEDDLIFICCLDAIKKILKVGDDNVPYTAILKFLVYGDDNISRLDDEDEDEDEDEDDEEEEEEEEDEDEAKAKAQLNEYAKMIDGYCLGWRMLVVEEYDDIFCSDDPAQEARRLVKRYRPDLVW